MRGRTRLVLKPAESGERTEVRLRCTLPALMPVAVLHQWLSQLGYWGGAPVHVVISADGPVWWQEPWTDALAEAPVRHLRVRFHVAGEDGHGE